MRSSIRMFSALLLSSCFFAQPTLAQQCSEELPPPLYESGEQEWIRLSNTTDQPLSLFGKTVSDQYGNTIELQGILFPGEDKIIFVSADENYEQPPSFETGAIELSELYANPAGDEAQEEFIELYNPTNTSISLNGWSIADASKSFSLDGYTIEANSFLVLERSNTSIALNNGSEQVDLIDPFDVIIDSFSYSSTTEGMSWNQQESWYESSPTKGTINATPILPDPDEVEEEIESSVNEASEELPPPLEDSTNNETAPSLAPELQDLLISELLANPEGSDETEWIELYNPTTESFSLNGLELADLTTTFLLEDMAILPGEYLVIERSLSGIALNNAGDTLTLSVAGSVIDTFTYTSSSEGLSWSRFNADWEESQPTPGMENVETKNEPPVTEEILETMPEVAAIHTSFQSAKKNQEITILGVVIAEEGILKKSSLFLQTTEGMIEVYASSAEFPDHAFGDLVEITGKKSETKSGPRLLFQDTQNFLHRGNEFIAPITLTNYPQLEAIPLASFVEVEGYLMEQNNDHIIIDALGTEMIIKPTQDTKIEMLPLQAKLRVQGLLWTSGSEKILQLFLSDHIHVLTEQQEDKPQELVITEEKTESSKEPLLVIGGLAGIGSYLFRGQLLTLLRMV